MMFIHVKSIVEKLIRTAEQYTASSTSIGICQHTNDVVAGDIYIAVGNKGLCFAKEALEKGAALVVYDSNNRIVDMIEHERIIGVEDFESVVRALVWDIYGHVINSVSLIGVTGTNGKTSTAIFLCELLSILGHKVGYIGTLGFGVIGQSITKARNTTPDMVTLYRYISILYGRGCQLIAIEISSHGIALNRIYGLSFFAGVFTNLSRDHIDFHGSMKNYIAVKCSFFTDYKMKSLVVNFDDKVGKKIFQDWGNNKPIFAFSKKYISPDILQYSSFGINANGKNQMTIQYEGKTYELLISLYGYFNIANLVAAIASCLAFNCPIEDLVQAALNLSPIPGRMEYLQTDHQVNVFIDYAHTPAGVQAALTDKSLIDPNIWCLLGSGGERDIGKRSKMASMTNYASHVVICDDNVRHDSATQIVIDMLRGIHAKSGIVICRDRRRAIEYVLLNACQGDNVFLLGKGNEDHLDYGTFKISHCDRHAVEKCSCDVK